MNLTNTLRHKCTCKLASNFYQTKHGTTYHKAMLAELVCSTKRCRHMMYKALYKRRNANCISSHALTWQTCTCVERAADLGNVLCDNLQSAAGDGLTWHRDVDGMALPPACPGFVQQP